MQGYIPYSDDFLFQDPEQIDEYKEWQSFARFLVKDKNQNINRLNEPEKRRRLKRHLLLMNNKG